MLSRPPAKPFVSLVVAAMFAGTAASLALAAPAPRYSNAGGSDPADPGLAPASFTATGMPAPAGLKWSEVQRDSAGNAGSLAGAACHRGPSTPARLADQFTVSGDPFGWSVASVRVYAYQPGYTGAASPITGANLRVWRGRPGESTSPLVWGDVTTNRLASAVKTNVRRILCTVAQPGPAAPDQSRAVWEVTISTPDLRLPPGTYWLDWQLVASDPQAELFSPLVTIAGMRGKPDADARQHRFIGGVPRWGDIIDPPRTPGRPEVKQEVPFIIVAEAAPSGCAGDADNNRRIDFGDITAVLASFGSQYPHSVGPGDANGDGVVSFADVTMVLGNFGSACL
jgi:hypothetical protein